MISKDKIGLGLAALLTAALVVPALADGAADFQVNARKASGTVDDIAKLIDGIHARVAAGGGSAAPTPALGGNVPAPGGGAGGARPVAALLAASCRCHTAGNAPKLTHIGADPKHTATWISEYAVNPKSKDPNSKMPPQRNVPAGALRRISTYLASQK